MRGMMAAGFSLLAGVALAVAPVAEWTDFHNLTSGDFTWVKDASCIVNSDGSLTIGKQGGLTMALSSGTIYDNKTVTIVADVEGLIKGGDKRAIFDISVSGNRVGLTTFTDGITYQTWDRDKTGYGNIGKLGTERTKLAFAYKGTAGTTTLVLDDGTKATNAGLWKSAGAINGLGIGCYNGSNNAAEGMTIHRLAIYDGCYTGIDDVGEYADHWYKFDGNLNSSGTTALSVNGEKTASYCAAPHGQGYLIVDGGHPYGSGLALGSGAWAVSCSARGTSTAGGNKKVFWSVGKKNACVGLAMADDTHVEAFQMNGETRVLQTAEVPTATTHYHHYTLVHHADDTYSLYVDGVLTGTSDAYAVTIEGNWQWGSVHSGCPTGYAKGLGIVLDDWRVWATEPRAGQVERLAAVYPVTVELDAIATHRMSFDGNLDGWGATALSCEGENGRSYVASRHGRAYKVDESREAHPYGSGFDTDAATWTLLTFARAPDIAGRVIWTVGTRTGGLLGLVAAGDGKVKVVKTTGDAATTALITSDTIANYASHYHMYLLVRSTDALTLYVDGEPQTQTATSADAAFANGNWQVGGVNGGFGSTGLSRGGVWIDEWRYYKLLVPTAQQVAMLTTFFPACQEVHVPVTFTPSMAADWADKTLPTDALSATHLVEMKAFGTDAAYLQTLASDVATVAWVENVGVVGTNLYGLAAVNGGDGMGAVTRDVYLGVTNSSMHIVSAGEDAGWASSKKTIPTGNLLTQIGGAAEVDYVFGAGRGGGGSGVLAEVKGHVGVTIEGEAQVLGTAVAGWSSAHQAKPKVTGNTSLLVKNVQTLPKSPITWHNDMERGWLVGGSAYERNGGGGEITGNSAVIVDLPDAATGLFMPWIVGGSLNSAGNVYNGMVVGGNSSVSVTAPAGVTFVSGIIGGGRAAGNSESQVAGNADVTLTGGVYTNVICAGGYANATVAGTATLTARGATFDRAPIQAGHATGTKTMQVGADVVMRLPGTTVEGFDSVAFVAGGSLTLDVTAEATFTAIPSGEGTFVKRGVGRVTLGTVPGAVATGRIEEGVVRFTLTDAQIAAGTAIECFTSTQTADALADKITAMSTAGVDVPGIIAKTGNVVTFTPTVEFYTRTVANGATISWDDSGWTRDGVPNQSYAPAAGKVADVRITLAGSATLNLASAPASLAALHFEKATAAATASVQVRLTPTAFPVDSAHNVRYSLFGLVPTLADGVSMTPVLNLASATYVWLYDADDVSFLATKRPDAGTFSLRIGARTTTYGYITPTLEDVGAVGLSGMLWTNALVWADNTARNPGYTDFGYVVDAKDPSHRMRYVFRGPNTYFSKSTSSTANGVLTATYVDDGDTAAATTWTITNALNKSEIVTLPAAPNSRGWQIHLDAIPYKAYDVYFITASDQSENTLKETPIYLSANGGKTWVAYTYDSGKQRTGLGTTNWDGLPYATGALVEGKNYLKMRVSKSIMGVEGVSTLEITHGPRNTGACIRSGLCAIQVQEIEDDGSFTLVGTGKWKADSIWNSVSGVGKWADGEDSYAIIQPSAQVGRVTVDGDVTAGRVTFSGANDFALLGSFTLSSDVDASQYTGMLTLAAPVAGRIAFGAAGRVGFDVANDDEVSAYDYTFNGTVTAKKLGTGTLVYGFASRYPLQVVAGTVRCASVAPGQTVELSADGTLVFDVPAGVTITNAAVVTGTGRIVKTGAGTLAMQSNNSNFSGAIEVREGTLLVQDNHALGTGETTVSSGATLDYGGCYPLNSIVISGSGVGGVGALINTGVAMNNNKALKVTLADDATIGGSARIHYGSTAAIDLAGHTLTFSGSGTFDVPLSTTHFSGGGTVVVGACTFSANTGASVLDGIALKISKSGTLDMAKGVSITCQDFVSEGTIVGSTAKLVVKGTLTATTAVTIGNLELADEATLVGSRLTVTGTLTLGDPLNINITTSESDIRVATVPVTTDVSGTTPYLNGEDGYRLYLNGTELRLKQAGTISAAMTIDSMSGGTNFESLILAGTVANFQGTATGTGVTNIHITAVAGDGRVITRKFAYEGDAAGHFSYVLDGLDAGCSYYVSAYLEIVGAKVNAQTKTLDAVTARTLDGWISENAKTFVGAEPGTGLWSGTNGVAAVSGNAIALMAEDWDKAADFSPTNNTLSVRSSAVKDLHYWATFNGPGFYACEEAPAIPAGLIAGMTLVADENDACRLAVVSDQGWQMVARETFAPETGKEYELHVRIDYGAGEVRYTWVNDGVLVPLITCSVASVLGEDLQLAFSGYGAIQKVEGVARDANLMKVGEVEYPDFASALVAAAGKRDIVPLWWSHYDVSEPRGEFRVNDPNGYLTIRFAKWYHYSITADGDVRLYRYIAGNNWIEYADVSGVVPSDDGWLVTNEVGLAWIAESSTNKWFCGNVTLGADLDLSSKNWTPIARFAGVLDGNDQIVRGLNNTNIVADLGALGVYPAGPTNVFGHTAYGLVATTTNAIFRNLVLADVAVSNDADYVAALLGTQEGGALVVSNVVLESGTIVGTGNAVAGLVGTAERWKSLMVADNETAATIVSPDAGAASPRHVAGVLTVGGDTETPSGPLTVKRNAHYGTLSAILRNNEDGGNVAHVMAGTTWAAKFGDVAIADNSGAGVMDVTWINHDAWRFELPVCNVAAAVVQTLAGESYSRFVEANAAKSIPIDPVYRTARMLSGLFANGAENIAGMWMDSLTASADGGTITLQAGSETLDFWDTVAIDRNVTIDLNGNCVYGLYDCTVFEIADGKKLTLKNGTLYYAHGYSPAVGTMELVNVDKKEIPGETFYDRTVPVSDLNVVENAVTIEIPYTSTSLYYVIESTPTLAEAWTLQDYEAGNGGTLRMQVPVLGTSGFYRVRITDFEPTDD